jgi:hypothetical protein
MIGRNEGRAVIADACKVSGKEFFDTLFPRCTQKEEAERIRLAREHQEAIQASYTLPHEEGMKVRERLNAEFSALVRAGKTEHMILLDQPYSELKRTGTGGFWS